MLDLTTAGLTAPPHDVTTYIFRPTSSGRGTSVQIVPVTAPRPCSAGSRGGGAHFSARASVSFHSRCTRDAWLACYSVRCTTRPMKVPLLAFRVHCNWGHTIV